VPNWLLGSRQRTFLRTARATSQTWMPTSLLNTCLVPMSRPRSQR